MIEYVVVGNTNRATNKKNPTGKINPKIHRFLPEVNQKWILSPLLLRREGQMSRIIAVLEMALMLAFAWGLDYWVSLLRKGALTNLNFIPMIWGIAVANILIALIWVYLAWLVLKRNAGSKLVSFTFFLVGLSLTIFLPLQLTLSENIRELFLFEQTRFLRLGIMGMIGFTSRFTISAAYICVLGGITFFVSNPVKGSGKWKKEA